jgi:hypothetical protein
VIRNQFSYRSQIKLAPLTPKQYPLPFVFSAAIEIKKKNFRAVRSFVPCPLSLVHSSLNAQRKPLAFQGQ